jgi:hypothetical protein
MAMASGKKKLENEQQEKAWAANGCRQAGCFQNSELPRTGMNGRCCGTYARTFELQVHIAELINNKF